MRSAFSVALAVVMLSAMARAEEPTKKAPNIVLRSPDGKQTYDLSKLTQEGPVLVRLTCACTGCDHELPYFQKLQAAYNTQGLKTLAVFREAPETTSDYVAKKDVRFLWVSDPKGELWKSFDAKTMPTNILIDKGGTVVTVLPGCTRDGKNAQTLSAEVAKLLSAPVAKIVEAKAEDKR
jgi:peroxiredoxin